MKSVLMCITAALVLLCAPARAQVTLATSLFVPPTHPIHRGVAKWCGEVAEATARRVTCNILPKPAAAPAAQFDAVRDGLADLAFGIHGYTPGRFKLTELAELPFLGDSAEATSVAYQRMYERHLARLGEHKGVRVVAVFTHGPGEIFSTKKAVASVVDFAGQKFRVGGGMVNDVARAMGANVILKPANESYELVSTGVVDGVFFPVESIFAHRIDGFIKYRTRFPGGLYNTSFFFVMNEDAWRRIAPADRRAIERLSGEHAARIIGKEWDATDDKADAMLKERGLPTTVANPAFVADVKARTASLEGKWVEEAKAKGLANAAEVVREFRAEIAKSH
jgi:TRAP-type C4-dicarboxylate transport system substrate-binding protein